MNEEERNRLAKEVVRGLREDERRRKVDDMKKKAILTSKSYEEFKNFVACANQKPVSSKEMSEFRQSIKSAKVQFNTTSGACTKFPGENRGDSSLRFGTGRGTTVKSRQREDGTGITPTEKKIVLASAPHFEVKDSRDFSKQWQRVSSPKDRFALLMSLETHRLSKIFGVDFDGSTYLGQIIDSLNKGLEKKEDAPNASKILRSLSLTSSFTMALSFLTRKQKDSKVALIEKIERCGKTLDAGLYLRAIQTAYR